METRKYSSGKKETLTNRWLRYLGKRKFSDFNFKSMLIKSTTWPGLLEAWLVLTSVKYHENLYILIPLNQRLALTRLRATGPWPRTKP